MSQKKFPETIGLRTKELEPLLRRWREEHPGVKWGYLLMTALQYHPEIRKLAGKRYAHLLDGTGAKV